LTDDFFKIIKVQNYGSFGRVVAFLIIKLLN